MCSSRVPVTIRAQFCRKLPWIWCRILDVLLFVYIKRCSMHETAAAELPHLHPVSVRCLGCLYSHKAIDLPQEGMMRHYAGGVNQRFTCSQWRTYLDEPISCIRMHIQTDKHMHHHGCLPAMDVCLPAMDGCLPATLHIATVPVA